MRTTASAVLALVATSCTLAQTASAQVEWFDRASADPRSANERAVLFPAGDVFRPLTGDPKEIHIFSGVQRGDYSVFDTAFYAAGIGQRFGLLRYRGLQISGSGGIFIQFDLLAESFDMLNADFIIGVPITFSKGPFSGRFRVYHQSSHLGDELLLRNPPVRRLNYSYESIEMLLSVEKGRFRVYGGGEYIADREHADKKPSGLLHGGMEVRSVSRAWDLGPWGRVGLFGSADLRSFEDLDWEISYSLRAGLEAELKRPGPFPFRTWHLLLEYGGGLAPYGQFYDRELRQWGISLHMGL